jgi:carotenoid 1,2-hydratase
MAVVVSQGLVADSHPGPVPGGRECAPGAGGADGHDVGPAGRRHRDGAPRFDQPVRPGGYLWWYLDAVSDDGRHALTVIAFVGSVFSPYYARAFERRGEAVDPENHVCINVALYGAGGHRWAMTERGRKSLSRSPTEFTVGPSSLRWNGQWFELHFDERECPLPRRLRGRIRIHPSAFTFFRADLDERGLHRWGPLAPCARVEVEVDDGGPRWQGHGYLDSNEGDEPIHRPFERWDWSRSTHANGHTSVIYDVQCKSGAQRLVLQRFRPDGQSETFEAPARHRLAHTAWGIARSTRGDPNHRAQVLKVFENTPFYVRDLVRTSLDGEVIDAVHESLDARRLASWPVRMMLPFRMPRLA